MPAIKHSSVDAVITLQGTLEITFAFGKLILKSVFLHNYMQSASQC